MPATLAALCCAVRTSAARASKMSHLKALAFDEREKEGEGGYGQLGASLGPKPC